MKYLIRRIYKLTDELNELVMKDGPLSERMSLMKELCRLLNLEMKHLELEFENERYKQNINGRAHDILPSSRT